MCGIAGIISLNNNIPLDTESGEQLRVMLGRLKHRGPDETGVCLNNDHQIGSVRLSIVGDKLGTQPVREGPFSLVYNGEIYNFHELAIEARIHNSNSDTYTLFHLLKHKLLQSINSLNGMFAFCFVTPQDIYLVRDRFGKKPLFYTVKNDKFYFSSEMKAFQDIVDFTIHISDLYESLEAEVGCNTIFENIFRVAAGGFVRINRQTKEVTQGQYYDFLIQNDQKKTERQLIDELRYLVTDATLIRNKTDKVTAAYVSGGIDSTIVAQLTEPKYLLSYLPNSTLVPDEEIYVDLLESQINNSKLIKLKSAKEDILKNLIDIVYINEGPTTTFGALGQYLLSKTASTLGVKVAFSGMGADEFLNGYARHAIAIVDKRYLSSSLFAGYEALVLRSSRGSSEKSIADIYESLLNRNLKESQTLKRKLKIIFSLYPPLTAISIADAQYTLPPLLHTDDYINMAFAVESRSPFMDYRLVEFAMNIPEEYKINIKKTNNQVITKYLLREAFKDQLPEEIYNRTDKVGFTSNIAERLKGDLRYLFDISLNLLTNTFPENTYFLQPRNVIGKYSRWEYQICQLAITYLLFTKKYSQEEVYEYYTSGKRNYR